MKLPRFIIGSLLFLLGCSSAVFADKITAEEGRAKVAGGALLVDVRTAEEFKSEHVEGAINIPYDSVKDRLKEFGDNPERDVVLYCKSGRRAGLAMEELEKNGFKHVFNAGGFSDWSQTSGSPQ